MGTPPGTRSTPCAICTRRTRTSARDHTRRTETSTTPASSGTPPETRAAKRRPRHAAAAGRVSHRSVSTGMPTDMTLSFKSCPFHQRRRSKVVVSTLGCISPSFKNRHYNDEHEETKLPFLFHDLSRSDKLSVSFSASRHCFLL